MKPDTSIPPVATWSLDVLEREVHRALSAWHKKEVGSPLANSIQVRRLMNAEHLDTHQATNRVLLSALDTMHTQHARDATLLRKRFVEGKPAFNVANELSLAEPTLYKLQHVAIRNLTRIFLEMEKKEEANRTASIVSRIPPPTYTKLIGTDSQLQAIQTVLLSSEPPWLIILTGLGGLGKTALAHRLVEDLIVTKGAYGDFGWVSAQHQIVGPSGQISSDIQSGLPATDLVAMLATQLLHPDSVPIPSTMPDTINALRTKLRRVPHLVVVDNLETVADLRTLLPTLRSLAGPSKFLLTSRRAIFTESDVFHFLLPELTESDAIRLVRHEAGMRNLPDLAEADSAVLRPIFETVGGNPLALKLLVGQLHMLTLQQVLDDLRIARGKKAEELYRFVYWSSWRRLSLEAQIVLLLMPLFAGSGTDLIGIERVADVRGADLVEALEELVNLSLVNVTGDFTHRRYSIHRLTETFLLREVVKWMEIEKIGT